MNYSISRSFLNDYVCNANNVIFFKLIRSPKDLDDNEGQEYTFHPEYSHQLFGQSENIFGYKNLRINLYYSASKLTRYMSINYSDKITKELSGGVPADDIQQIIEEKLRGTFLTNIDQFSSLLDEDKDFKPYGTLLDSFKIQDKKKSNYPIEREFEIYRADMDVNGFESHHQNMESFLIWFIEAASNIDVDDRRWDYFVTYEKCQDLESSTNFVYYFTGFATVYRCYAYPDRIRPRISQFLILPPFQRRGLGNKLLQNIYQCYYSDSSISDITVEDPSEEFCSLRDYVDCKNCATLSSYKVSELKKGWSDEMAKEAQEKFRLNKKQARKVYEILKLKSINRHDAEEMRSFRLEVKSRLNAPYIKGKKATFIEENLVCENKETRVQELDLLYSQLEEDYRKTIQKLESE